MEKYWFLVPMLRLAISSASLNIFFWNSPQSFRCTSQRTRLMKKTTARLMKKTKATRVTQQDVLADWAEKYFSSQSAGRNSTTSGTGSVRVSSQGFFSSWSKLSPKNIALSRLEALGLPGWDVTPLQVLVVWRARGARTDASKIEQNKANNNRIQQPSLFIYKMLHPIHRVRIPYSKFSSLKRSFSKVALKMGHTRLTQYFSLSNAPMTPEDHWYECARGRI